jgi:squalene synthase HpnC
MSINHYENFPVASLLLPRHLRKAVTIIYRFARSADDLADEGHATPAERQRSLAHYAELLDSPHPVSTDAAVSEPVSRLFLDLHQIIDAHQLDKQYFHDLLSAFTQDTHIATYPDLATLLDYCQRSANPVGRLMLQLHRADTAQNRLQSDQICSALQLINFWQDVAIDLAKDRIYIPQDDLQQHGLSSADLKNGQVTDSWRQLMNFEIDRTRSMMHAGAPLALKLPGRIGWELRLVVQGGLRILEKIERVDYDVFHRRPTLNKLDSLLMLARGMLM